MKIFPLSFLVLCLALALPAFASSASRPISADYAGILENRIQTLEEQVRTLTNQVEQAQFQARTAQDRLARLEEDMNTRFRMIEGSAAGAGQAPDLSPSSSSSPSAPAAASVDSDAQRLGQLTGGAAPVMPDDPNVAYDQAFQKIRTGDYEAAESALRAFLQKWPNNELSSNASYWLGETYYVRGDYPAAAKAFAEGYQTYSKGAKAEDTLLKLALTLGALGRKRDACVTFEQMSAEFPRMSSTNRRRIEQERAQLECSSTSSSSSRSNRNR